MTWLTDEELSHGASTQDQEWGMGGSKSEQRNTPADLAEDRGAADHLDRRWLVSIMLPRQNEPATAPRRPRGVDPGPTWVYIVTDDPNDRELYVGVTCMLQERLRAHRRSQPWWHQATHVHAFLYATRAEALAWEARFINEGTAYNISIPPNVPAPSTGHPFVGSLDSEQFIVGEDI